MVWVYPSENSGRCTVCIVDKYMSLLPPVKPNAKRANFYLRSLEKYNPAQWYGEQVVGLNTLRKVMGEVCSVVGANDKMTEWVCLCVDVVY